MSIKEESQEKTGSVGSGSVGGRSVGEAGSESADKAESVEPRKPAKQPSHLTIVPDPSPDATPGRAKEEMREQEAAATSAQFPPAEAEDNDEDSDSGENLSEIFGGTIHSSDLDGETAGEIKEAIGKMGKGAKKKHKRLWKLLSREQQEQVKRKVMHNFTKVMSLRDEHET